MASNVIEAVVDELNPDLVQITSSEHLQAVVNEYNAKLEQQILMCDNKD